MTQSNINQLINEYWNYVEGILEGSDEDIYRPSKEVLKLTEYEKQSEEWLNNMITLPNNLKLDQ